MEIKNTSELVKETKVNMLLYGSPGSGKTTIAGTFPKALYLNIEAGVSTLIGTDTDFVDITKWDDMKEVFDTLTADGSKYESVIIDSVTELMKRKKAEMQGSEEALSQRQWGILIDQMENMLRSFRDLPINVLFIFSEKEIDDEGLLVKRPSISGKSLPTTACGFVDVVGYTKVKQGKEIEYLTQLTPDKRVYAKSRFPKLSGDIKDFTFDKVKSSI